MKKTNLTAHMVVKNEAFVYYACKSVYDYCDEILLWDTGSTDETTLKDILKLLEEDVDRKIRFKQVQLGFDEEKWSLDNIQSFIKEHHGKRSVGKCRQMQIDATKTKYFMLVDGDEVHYRTAMHHIVKELLPKFPKDKLAIGLPLQWFYNLDSTFTTATFPYNGRIYVTDKVYMSDESPNEQHLIKGTSDFFTYEHPQYLCYGRIIPYAHFESVLRPWRRKHLVSQKNIKSFNSPYPEVMYENSYYMARWIDKQKNGA